MNTNISRGIVAFLDILGYESFLENNEPEVAAETVIRILTEIPAKVLDLHKLSFTGADVHKYIENRYKDMQWLIFSDTILFLYPYSSTADIDEKSNCWLLSLGTLCVLYKHLFDSGLPARGAISAGSFFTKGQCFAGRPIIRAYQASRSINLSAVVLDNEGKKEFESVSGGRFHVTANKLLFDYLLPMKDGTSASQTVLSPSIGKTSKYPGKDIRQYVAEAFWKHNKQVAPNVLPKVLNTEMFFRYCKTTRDYIFEE